MRRRPLAWLRRAARRLWPARNPMCRPSDRIEAAVLRAACVVVLVATAAGVLLGLQTAARAEHVAQRARVDVHPHRVVLLEDAPAGTSVSGRAGAVGAEVPVRARWDTSTGARTGVVHVAAATPAGARVTVWFDAHGRETTRPETRLGTAMDGVGPGLSVPLATAAAGALAVFGARSLLDRRRRRDWARDWRRVEPIWTRRPRRDFPA